MNNIYDTPNADLTNDLDVNYKLFKITGIGLATFFGTVFAGGILMAINFSRLGREAEAKKALIFSALATLAIIGVSFLIPDDVNIPSVAFTVPQIIIMIQLAKKHQASDIESHVNLGGKTSSNWIAFGISLLVLIPLLFVIFGIAFLFV